MVLQKKNVYALIGAKLKNASYVHTMDHQIDSGIPKQNSCQSKPNLLRMDVKEVICQDF